MSKECSTSYRISPGGLIVPSELVPDHANGLSALELPFDHSEKTDKITRFSSRDVWHVLRDDTPLRPHFGQECIADETIQLDVPPEVLSFCQKLRSFGGRALIVGGYVRDELMREIYPEDFSAPSKDLDFEVYGMHQRDVVKLLEDTFGQDNVSYEGKTFGVLKVRIPSEQEPIDIAVTRRERKTGSGGNKGFDVETDNTMSLTEASVRRDLTINSISYDPTSGVIYDPFGGVKDIRYKCIKVVNPETFQEDPTRILRVMQFAARFGFSVDPSTEQLCSEMVADGRLSEIYIEQVENEFKKLMLKGKQPSAGLRFAERIGMLKHYMPELTQLRNTPQSPIHHPEGDALEHTYQVVDAMAEIIRREQKNPNFLPTNTQAKLRELNEAGNTLAHADLLSRATNSMAYAQILTALCHDLGKITNTQISDGRITSHGHEEAGIDIASAMLTRLRVPNTVRDFVLHLIPHHMKPFAAYRNAGISNRDPDALPDDEATKIAKEMRKLYIQLVKRSLTLEHLMLICEADKRGRNSSTTAPHSLEDCPDLQKKLEWMRHQHQLIVDKDPENAGMRPLLNGNQILLLAQEAGLKMRPGPWVGEIIERLLEAQIHETVTTPDEADTFVKQYLQTMIDSTQ